MSNLVHIQSFSSLGEEKFVKDGSEVSLHVVLKDKPFIVELAIDRAQAKGIDFRHTNLEVSLHFDNAEQKEVSLIKAKPFEYTCKISRDGSLATLECYAHILSSQNQGALFKLHVKVINAATRELLQAVESSSVQIISKPSVLKKKLEREKAKVDAVKSAVPMTIASLSKPLPPVVSTPVPSVGQKRGRDRDDEIFDALIQIQRQQQEQQKLFSELLAWKNSQQTSSSQMSSGPTSPDSTLGGSDSSHASPYSATSEEPTDDFTRALKAMVSSFHNIDPSERPTKLRRALKEVEPASLVPVMDLLWTENFQRELDTNAATDTDADELNALPGLKVDDFSNFEFLNLPGELQA